jgi:hypothetical protein
MTMRLNPVLRKYANFRRSEGKITKNTGRKRRTGMIRTRKQRNVAKDVEEKLRNIF